MNGKEFVINIKGMLRYIQKKWKMIVASMIVFCFAFSALFALNVASDVKENQRLEDASYREQKANEFASKIDEKEIEEVVETHDLKKMYENQCSEEKKYYKNSLMMKINAAAVPTCEVQYQLTCSQTNGLLDNIFATYDKGLVTQEFCDTVSEKLGDEVGSDYIGELITVSRGNNENSDTIILQGGDTTMLLNLTVVADTEEHAKAIMQSLQERINIYSNELKNTYGAFDINFIDEQYSVNVMQKIADTQKTKRDSISTLTESIDKIENPLSDAQKKYYKYLYIGEAENKNTESDYFSKKMALLGILLGAFLMVFVLVLKYIFSVYIKEVGDVAYYFDTVLFGKPISSKDISKNKELLEPTLQRIILEIKISIEKENMSEEVIKELVITSSLDTEDVAYVEMRISEGLKAQGVSIQSIKSCVENVDSLTILNKTDGVIVVEKVMKSLNSNILKEMELFNRCNTKVLGNVMLTD